MLITQGGMVRAEAGARQAQANQEDAGDHAKECGLCHERKSMYMWQCGELQKQREGWHLVYKIGGCWLSLVLHTWTSIMVWVVSNIQNSKWNTGIKFWLSNLRQSKITSQISCRSLHLAATFHYQSGTCNILLGSPFCLWYLNYSIYKMDMMHSISNVC